MVSAVNNQSTPSDLLFVNMLFCISKQRGTDYGVNKFLIRCLQFSGILLLSWFV